MAQSASGPIRGEWGRVEWATDGNGNTPALSYYLELPDSDQAKINALLKLLADRGFIQNREKFKKLGSKAKGKGSELWEIKSFQLRFLGDYRQNASEKKRYPAKICYCESRSYSPRTR